MESNKNWPGVAALVLAALALFVAVSGRFGDGRTGATPGNIVINVGSGGTTAPAAVAATTVPSTANTAPAQPDKSAQAQADQAQKFGWGPGPWAQAGGPWNGVHPGFGGGPRGFGGPFHFLPMLFLIGLAFLAFRFFRRRNHWRGGPSGPHMQ